VVAVAVQVAAAVQAGAPLPDLSSEEAVRQAVLAAPTLGYSTGPSGVALAALFQRWGISAEVQGRIVQAKPGVPVARLIADGEVALGFQQLAELLNVPGVDVLGTLPGDAAFITTFSAGRCPGPAHAGTAACLAFLASPDADAAKRRHGMEPA